MPLPLNAALLMQRIAVMVRPLAALPAMNACSNKARAFAQNDAATLALAVISTRVAQPPFKGADGDATPLT